MRLRARLCGYFVQGRTSGPPTSVLLMLALRERPQWGRATVKVLGINTARRVELRAEIQKRR